MSTPRGKTYSAPSGAAVYGGRFAPPPAWLSGQPLYEQIEIAGTRFSDSPDYAGWVAPGGTRQGLFAYSGGALDPVRSRLWRAGGGHADYAGNDPWMLDLLADAPVWRQQRAPTTTVAQNVSHYSDGRPTSRHTYWHIQYSTQRDLLMFAAASAVWGDGNSGFSQMDAFDPATGDYVAAGTFAGGLSSIYATPCWQDSDGNIWTHSHFNGAISKWTEATNTVSTPRTGSQPVYETAYCYVPGRNIVVRFFNAGVASGYLDLNQSNAPFTAAPVGGPAAAVFEPGGSGNHRYSATYDPDLDCIWVLKRYSSQLYKVTIGGSGPYTLSAEAVSTTNAVADWAAGGDAANTYGAFAYVPALKGLVWSYRMDRNARFIRTS